MGQPRPFDEPPVMVAVLDGDYHAVPVVDAGAKATELVDLVGPLCNSDEVGAKRMMPPLKRGDLVAFLDTGGYTGCAPPGTTRSYCRQACLSPAIRRTSSPSASS